MAIDFIKVDRENTAATHASLLLRYISALRLAYNLGKETIAIMNHNQDGSTWTTLEGLFGLPAGKGNTVFDLCNGSLGSMEGSFQVADAKTITEKVG